jgi:hypothetical protein
MYMAKAMDHLAKAERNNAELIGTIREQARKEAAAEMEKAAKAAIAEAGDGPLPPERIFERIRAIYRGEA